MKLSNEYIRGLIDGEGCFTFHTRRSAKKGIKTKGRVPAFALSMHWRDTELVEAVRDSMGLKNRVYRFKSYQRDGHMRGDKVVLVVREFGQLKNIIIPFFYKKLHGYKARQFINWLEKIGTDPTVGENYRLLYRLYKCGFYDREMKYKD